MAVENRRSSELNKLRNFFHLHFPMIRIARQRIDINSEEALKNSCPACGYLTLPERDGFDICPICFWEDDGLDDSEASESSGPNHTTLTEYRVLVQDTLERLRSNDFPENDIRRVIKEKFNRLDVIIHNYRVDKKTVLLQTQEDLIEVLTENKIYGIDTLFTDK